MLIHSCCLQIKYFLGLSAHRSIHIDRTIRRIIEHLPEFQWRELVMGLSWLAILVIMKHLGKTRRYAQHVTPQRPPTRVCLHVAQKGMTITSAAMHRLSNASVGIQLPGSTKRAMVSCAEGRRRRLEHTCCPAAGA